MPTSDYTPTTQQVAMFLRARTKDSVGNYVNDFTTDTAVTVDVATGLIAAAADEVSDAIGPDVAPEFISNALRATTLLAAANIEMSFAPEQSSTTGSMYDKLMTRYNSLLTQLTDNVDEETEESEELQQEPIALLEDGFPEANNWGSVSW